MIRTAHGEAKKHGARVVVETQPLQEQPAGIPAPPDGESPGDRDALGRFTSGNSMAARGGRRRAEIARWETELSRELGLGDVAEELRPLVHQAREWAETQAAWFAQTVGGGQVGPDAGALIQAAARDWFAHLDVMRMATAARDPDLYVRASQLADKARTKILTARDLCVVAAKSQERPYDAIAAIRADAAEVARQLENGEDS